MKKKKYAPKTSPIEVPTQKHNISDVTKLLSDNTQDRVLSKIRNDVVELVTGKAKDKKFDKNIESVTELLNQEYTKFREQLDSNLQDLQQESLNPQDVQAFAGEFGDVDMGMFGFQSIPRTDGIAGLFVVPPSKVSDSQNYNASLDSIIGTQLQYLRSFILANLKEYSHPNKKWEKLVKKMMWSVKWETNFMFGATNYLRSGNSCGELVWDYCPKLKDWYISDIVFVPTTNLQYMVDFKGRMVAAIQPNVFADPEGLFGAIDSAEGESEFALREYIPRQLPYMIKPASDLFYIAYDNVTNPYGISLVRRAYQAFQNKQIVLNMLMHASAKNSAPFMVAYYDKNSIQAAETGELEAIRQTLASLSVGDTATVPNTMKIDAIDVNKGSIESLINLCHYYDALAIRAMLGGSPSGMDLGEGSGSYASKSEDTETLERTLDLHLRTMIDAINRTLLLPMAIHNGYTDVYEDLDFGTWISSESTLNQKLQIVKIFEGAVNSGMVNNMNLEVVNHFLDKLGLPKAVKDDLTGGLMGMKSNQRDLGTVYSHQSGKVE